MATEREEFTVRKNIILNMINALEEFEYSDEDIANFLCCNGVYPHEFGDYQTETDREFLLKSAIIKLKEGKENE